MRGLVAAPAASPADGDDGPLALDGEALSVALEPFAARLIRLTPAGAR